MPPAKRPGDLGRSLTAKSAGAYQGSVDADPYRINGVAIGRRALRNACFTYLTAAEKGTAPALAQFESRSQYD